MNAIDPPAPEHPGRARAQAKETEVLIRVARVAVLAVVLAVGGCGGKERHLKKVVAKAGDIEVTLGDFVDAFNRITPTNQPDISTLEAKRKFASDLVNQRILVAEARKTAAEMDPAARKFLDDRRKNEILAALFRDEVETKVEVQAADVEDLYNRRGTNVRASHILLEDMATASQVHTEITAGRITFENAAKKYSLDQSTKLKGGDLGEIMWMRTLPTFQERAFSQEPGTISAPFETTFGVHILRVDERIKKELPPFDQLRVQLRTDVRRQKEQQRTREFNTELQQKWKFAWNEDGVRELQAAVSEMMKQNPDTIAAEKRFIPPADDARRQVVLATFGDRKWTVGDYVAYVEAQPASMRAPVSLPTTGLKELILATQINPELALLEAEERKIGERPEIKDAVVRREEQLLIEILHSRFLQTADVTPEEVRAFYDSTAAANPEAFQYQERVDMILLAHPEEKVVRDALRRIRSGEDEAKVVSEVTVEARTKQTAGRTGFFSRGTFAPTFEDVAFSGRVGKGWSEPIATEGGSGAVKVLAQEPPRKARFDEVEATLTQGLAQARGEKAFEDWLQAERTKRNVEIFDDALELYDQAITAPAKAPAQTS